MPSGRFRVRGRCAWTHEKWSQMERQAAITPIRGLKRGATGTNPGTTPLASKQNRQQPPESDQLTPQQYFYIGIWGTHPSALGRGRTRGTVGDDQFGLRSCLHKLGLKPSLCAAAIGAIIARMACPGSERATRRWLGARSALDELLGVDFATMGPM